MRARHDRKKSHTFVRREGSSLKMSDHEYLLRCALTHDWDAMIQFSEWLATSTAVAVQEEEEEEEEEDEQHPYRHRHRHTGTASSSKQHKQLQRQLHARDHYGNSVLQLACYHRPPVSAIRSLLFRAVATRHERQALVRHRAADGSTALQVACATGASIEVIGILVSLAADLTGEYDMRGSSPISELTVQYSLERLTPGHRRTSRPLDAIATVDAELVETKEVDAILFRTFWTKLCLLLLGEIEETVVVDAVPMEVTADILCRAAAISHTIPTSLTDLLVRSCCSPGAAIPLALHVALRQPCHREQEECRVRQEYFLSRLLQYSPPAALSVPMAVATNDGSPVAAAAAAAPVVVIFPLAVAAQQGYSFDPILHAMATIAPHTIGRSLPWIARYGTAQDFFCILQLQPQALQESCGGGGGSSISPAATTAVAYDTAVCCSPNIYTTESTSAEARDAGSPN
jgi:hypothetical protein